MNTKWRQSTYSSCIKKYKKLGHCGLTGGGCDKFFLPTGSLILYSCFLSQFFPFLSFPPLLFLSLLTPPLLFFPSPWLAFHTLLSLPSFPFLPPPHDWKTCSTWLTKLRVLRGVCVEDGPGGPEGSCRIGTAQVKGVYWHFTWKNVLNNLISQPRRANQDQHRQHEGYTKVHR